MILIIIAAMVFAAFLLHYLENPFMQIPIVQPENEHPKQAQLLGQQISFDYKNAKGDETEHTETVRAAYSAKDEKEKSSLYRRATSHDYQKDLIYCVDRIQFVHAIKLGFVEEEADVRKWVNSQLDLTNVPKL